MAFLVVITWHIYNAHLNPDVFPFDTTIFTGRSAAERMEHEHPLELDRLTVSKEPRRLRPIRKPKTKRRTSWPPIPMREPSAGRPVRRGIQTRLAVLVLVAAIVPILVFGWITLQSLSATRRAILDRAQRFGRNGEPQRRA
jgi:hypothetical protein